MHNINIISLLNNGAHLIGKLVCLCVDVDLFVYLFIFYRTRPLWKHTSPVQDGLTSEM